MTSQLDKIMVCSEEVRSGFRWQIYSRVKELSTQVFRLLNYYAWWTEISALIENDCCTSLYENCCLYICDIEMIRVPSLMELLITELLRTPIKVAAEHRICGWDPNTSTVGYSGPDWSKRCKQQENDRNSCHCWDASTFDRLLRTCKMLGRCIGICIKKIVHVP